MVSCTNYQPRHNKLYINSTLCARVNCSSSGSSLPLPWQPMGVTNVVERWPICCEAGSTTPPPDVVELAAWTKSPSPLTSSKPRKQTVNNLVLCSSEAADVYPLNGCHSNTARGESAEFGLSAPPVVASKARAEQNERRTQQQLF